MRATTRDREIVAWIARVGAVEAEQVMARCKLGRTVAYRRLATLVACELVDHVRLLHGEPGLYVATPDGLRWSGLEALGRCRVSVGEFAHWRACGWVAVSLEREFGLRRVLSDRELRVAERDAGRPLASAVIGTLPDGRPRVHRPDFAVRGRDEDSFDLAVEVELSVKGSRRLAAICRGYARNRRLGGVRYYAAPAPARAVARTALAVGAQELIAIQPVLAGDVEVTEAAAA